MFDLKGKVALVTGGSRGIGRATAEALAAQGAHVALTYVRNEAEAQAVVDTIVQRGGSAERVTLDVRDPAQCDAVVADVAKRHGRLDALVANAGVAIDGLLIRMSDDELDALWNTNVRGALACARAAVKVMMRAKRGRVVFLSSVVGEMGNAGQAGYSATKAALLGVAKSLAKEYGSRGITFNAVSPGFIDTDMTSAIPEGMKAKLLEAIPLGRTGRANEVAAAVAYLCSDEAAYVTGQSLRVNGGMYG
jgi:3-oxoacyl-[acyl-carrier protein] reductase